MQVTETVSQLAELILKHKRLYYRGVPEISDQDYDVLEEQLKKLAPDHPVLMMVGAPVDSTTSDQKVRHQVPMLSLNKTYDLSELLKWCGPHPVIGTYKIDGNSLSLIYENGQLSQAKTRGDGSQGEDVLDKIKWVADCCPTLDPGTQPEPSVIEIRGELYCSTSAFERLVTEMKQCSLEAPASPRNIVAGILGRKQHLELARHFNFFAFDVIDHQNQLRFETETEKLTWLKDQGFQLPESRLITSRQDVESFLDQTKEFMGQGAYGIDGAVFSYNELRLHRSLGSTAHHPRYRISFKWQGETALTTIRHIQWATSRLGIITPVAVTEPVTLSHATITNITLHNAAHVKMFNLKAGDRIEIVRSGEVIPKFLRVVHSEPGVHELPTHCPSCNEPVWFDDVRLNCENASGCPDQILGSILNWIRCAGIDDLSEKRLAQMIELKLVSHPADLYQLSVETLMTLPLTKEKMAQKLWTHIQESKSITLTQFLKGLGVKGMGTSMWELLLDQCPTLSSLQNADIDQIKSIKGFATKTAEAVVSGLKEKADDINKLLDAGVTPSEATGELTDADQGSSAFSGKQFVLTGSMNLPRNELAKMIKDKGGKVTGSVSKNTFALIIADPDSGSSKAKKARELNIPLWSEDDLLKELKE